MESATAIQDTKSDAASENQKGICVVESLGELLFPCAYIISFSESGAFGHWRFAIKKSDLRSKKLNLIEFIQ